MERKIILKKQEQVKEVSETIKGSASVYVVEYRGLNVAKLTELRTLLRNENNQMLVFKNNIANRAFTTLGHEEMTPYLVGPNAFIFSKDDAVSGARLLSNFARKNRKLVLKSALVEGKVIDSDEIKTLATLPDKDGMISRLLGLLNAPVRNLAVVLSEVAKTK